MLILTRRVGEGLVIGRDITISVVGVKGNKVRLGIDSPAQIPVYREEIAERIRREAASPDAQDGAAAQSESDRVKAP